MASERQIAANRRNARKSAGPQSRAGRKRASRNAYRHGLSQSITLSAAFVEKLDKLTRKIAGDADDAIILECARAVAHAELELERVRQAKVALIPHVLAFGTLNPPPRLSTRLIIAWLKAAERYLPVPKPIDHLATMPSQEPDRSAEAVRRALPELLKLDRYERRASAMRDRAVYNLAKVARKQGVTRGASAFASTRPRRCS